MTARRWKFLTSHALVLAAVADLPDARLADVSRRVGITERATHGILKDLKEAGYVTITRVGRRNSYRIDDQRYLRHPTMQDIQVKRLLDIFDDGSPRRRR